MPYLYDPDELVSSSTTASGQGQESKHSEDGHRRPPIGLTTDRVLTDPLLKRMELLYVTLWRGLRVNVREAFACNSDVLEAGTLLQVCLYIYR